MATDPQSPVTLDQLVRAVVSHNPDGDALVHLRDAVLVGRLLDDQADQLIGHFGDEARESGASWTAIGESLGVSKQAAQQRFVLGDDDLVDLRGRLFGRFTPRARQAVATGRDEAQRLDADRVEPAHLVLGLLSETEGIAARALAEQGVELAAARARFAEPASPAKKPPKFANETKRVMQVALREALTRGHNYIGTEHLLLGVLAAGEGSGVELLAELGADGDAAEAWIDETLASPQAPKKGRHGRRD
jgi:hypothetical protein